MESLRNFFNGENIEGLFFIVVFLLVFHSNISSGEYRIDSDFEEGSILFFITLFILLFFNIGYPCDRSESI